MGRMKLYPFAQKIPYGITMKSKWETTQRNSPITEFICSKKEYIKALVFLTTGGVSWLGGDILS